MKKMNYCYECGERLDAGAAKCDGCGKVYRRERGSLSVSGVLKRSLCLLVAFLFLLSAFTPIVYAPVPMGDDEATIKFSAIDTVELTFASLHNYSDEALESSAIAKESNKAYEKFAEYLYEENIDITEPKFDELSSEGRRLFKAYILASIKMTVASERYVTGPAIIMAGIVAMLYMLVCIGAFILALISFIAGFIPAMMKWERLFRYSVKLILLSAVGSLAALIAIAGAIGIDDMRLGGFALIGFVATLLLAVALWIIRRVSDGDKFNIATAVKRGICIVVCFAAIMLCFAPLYKTGVKTTFSGASKDATVSFYYNYSDFSDLMTEDELDAIDEMRDELKNMEDTKTAKKEYMLYVFEQFGWYTVADAKDGMADHLDDDMQTALLTVSNSGSAYRLSNLFTIIEVSMLFTAVLLSLAIYESLKYFATGRVNGRLYRIYSACGAICALITVLLAVVYIAMLCGGLTFAPKGYSVGIAAGAIFFAVFSIAPVCLPYGKTRQTVENETVENVADEA